jgi:hypothetical protein
VKMRGQSLLDPKTRYHLHFFCVKLIKETLTNPFKSTFVSRVVCWEDAKIGVEIRSYSWPRCRNGLFGVSLKGWVQRMAVCNPIPAIHTEFVLLLNGDNTGAKLMVGLYNSSQYSDSGGGAPTANGFPGFLLLLPWQDLTNRSYK